MDVDTNAKANADAGGSTIALCERCSGELKKKWIKSNQEKVVTIFPTVSQWGLSVAMDTKVLIQSASKHYAAFPHSLADATHKIWSRLANWPLRYFKFESVKFSSFKGK